MMVDALAGEPHFADHLIPTYLALPDGVRGNFHARTYPVQAHLATRGITAMTHLPPKSNNLIMVASYKDWYVAKSRRARIVFSEHGCGQTFRNADGSPLSHRSYAGSPMRENVVLFLCPGYPSAQVNAEAHPGVPVAIVGCPKLDKWHERHYRKRDPPVLAVGFHWRCRVCPETDTAFDYFKDALPELAEHYRLLGHGHPRFMPELRHHYRRMSIEVEESFDRVLERADLYINDSSSTLFEFASTGRPVVVLNSPKYRRDVHHGLRFWECSSVGVNCDHPKYLMGAVMCALDDAPGQKRLRREAVRRVYAHTDGKATERAVRAIMKVVG